MFVLTDVGNFTSINIKCEPETVIQRIDEYSAVNSGYHMNKKYWITVMMDGTISDHKILLWVDESYDLVYSRLPAKIKSGIIS